MTAKKFWRIRASDKIRVDVSPTPERWRSLDELFHAALEVPPAERAAFLIRACPDEALRRAVESLLNFEPEGDALLKNSPWAQTEPLHAGTELGPYQVRERIGAGGMGEVYKARDPRLGREVALKVLPAMMMGDAASRGRFVREAQAASRLNHPNIVTIHDIGESSGRVFIAMEYVAGKTLAASIPRGGMPLPEALKYAAPIAAALATAHDAGIVHRDLKPGNIMVTPEGVVKVLDFGLARFANSEAEGADARSTRTLSAKGTILGTPQYMAPEQAQGRTVDKRADIWAFGVVFCEMLTGQRPFTGDTIADVLAAVLTKEPDWERVPKRAGRMLRRCLEKDPQRRLRDIGDIWDLLEPDDTVHPAGQPYFGRWKLAAGLLVLTTIAGFGLAWRASRPAERPLTRLTVELGPEAIRGESTTVAISPDGRRLVYPARAPDGKPQLATRLLDQDQATMLPGTDNGFDPFFSPDGQWVGFFTGSELKKVSVRGGAPVTLCPAGYGRGAAWAGDGNIILAATTLSALLRVPEGGGTPQPFTRLGTGEASHRWPQALPGGTVLFGAQSLNVGAENGRFEAITKKTGSLKVLPLTGYGARYLPTGHLLYARQGVLYGVRFDPDSLEARGSPSPLLEDLSANPFTGGGQYAFSESGTLVYLSAKHPAVIWQLAWLDGSGKFQPLNAAPGVYTNPRVSPDGNKLAVLNGPDIFIYDLQREASTRLTSGQVTSPIWALDGKHLVYISVSDAFRIVWVRSDGAGEPVTLVESKELASPWSFAPDGRLAYYTTSPGSGNDIWTLRLDLSDPDHPKPGKPELFLGTPTNELVPRFSPDGKWIAYRSDESGQNEIYVRPFAAGSAGGKWQISAGGGMYGIWSKNGRELFYETPDSRIMVVDYTIRADSFTPGKPRLWCDTRPFATRGVPNLDLAPDGKRFLVFAPPESSTEPVRVAMLENFFDELRRRLP